MPYPTDVYTENGYPVVVVTPVALVTLGRQNSHTAIQQYETAYNSMGIGGGKGWYGSGMINTGEQDSNKLLQLNRNVQNAHFFDCSPIYLFMN